MLVRVARVRNEALWLDDSLRKCDSELWPKENRAGGEETQERQGQAGRSQSIF